MYRLKLCIRFVLSDKIASPGYRPAAGTLFNPQI
jgi:hypothetical protein